MTSRVEVSDAFDDAACYSTFSRTVQVFDIRTGLDEISGWISPPGDPPDSYNTPNFVGFWPTRPLCQSWHPPCSNRTSERSILFEHAVYKLKSKSSTPGESCISLLG